LVVGLPSLRLRGDYLAIVTLGFGEILRVLAPAHARRPARPRDDPRTSHADARDNLGGALGFTGSRSTRRSST
jgi:hypothetical protein